MKQNKASGIYTNNLNSHASLLLSASPTIITSPLQNNTNNSQSAISTASLSIVRRQPSVPLLASSNIDNESHVSNESPTNINLNEGYINFKKPQNEMFKKLDGKIQKIVAAHSNLNKLYALNDFSSLGVGPKRPFELPPQLPPPPPWIPKVSNEHVSNQWIEESVNVMNTFNTSSTPKVKTNQMIFNTNTNVTKPIKTHEPSVNLLANKSCNFTIDSAILKLHHRREQKNQSPGLSTKSPIVIPSLPLAGSSTTLQSNSRPSITPAQFSLLAQKIKETLAAEGASKRINQKTNVKNSKRIQEELIALLTEEISTVTKKNKLNFSTPTKPKSTNEEKSLLLKSSPQTLYNTIRRETSLLLNKRELINNANNKFGSSLLFGRQMFNAHKNKDDLKTAIVEPHQANNIYRTIKVIVSPTEYYSSRAETKESSGDMADRVSESSEDLDFTKNPDLTYQVIKNKMRLFLQTNQIQLGRVSQGKSNIGFMKKMSSQKSLDRIVDRLQAKCSPSISEESVQSKLESVKQQPVSSLPPPPSLPTPIPVFRSSVSTSRVNLKSKKSKRCHSFGLKLSNYLEVECPQPTIDDISIEDYARCLDLVRKNDARLQRHKEQRLQSETRWRIPIGNRPLRLRRIRGERIHMPASASYKATRKVGLK